MMFLPSSGGGNGLATNARLIVCELSSLLFLGGFGSCIKLVSSIDLNGSKSPIELVDPVRQSA